MVLSAMLWPPRGRTKVKGEASTRRQAPARPAKLSRRNPHYASAVTSVTRHGLLGRSSTLLVTRCDATSVGPVFKCWIVTRALLHFPYHGARWNTPATGGHMSQTVLLRPALLSVSFELC
jgi:hypothetical protein